MNRFVFLVFWNLASALSFALISMAGYVAEAAEFYSQNGEELSLISILLFMIPFVISLLHLFMSTALIYREIAKQGE